MIRNSLFLDRNSSSNNDVVPSLDKFDINLTIKIYLKAIYEIFHLNSVPSNRPEVLTGHSQTTKNFRQF